MSDYAILMPTQAPILPAYRLVSTVAFAQWIERSDKSEVTPKPKDAIEHSAIGLGHHDPTTITQKLIAECRKIQRKAELTRPSCLSPAYLKSQGYDLNSPDSDPSNLAIVSQVIQENLEDFERFNATKLDSSLNLIDLIYPDSGFQEWRVLTIDDSPMDVETLTNFAVEQVDAFLSSSSGLLLIVSPSA